MEIDQNFVNKADEDQVDSSLVTTKIQVKLMLLHLISCFHKISSNSEYIFSFVSVHILNPALL